MTTSNKGIPTTEYVYTIIMTILGVIVIFGMFGCDRKNTEIKQLQYAYDMYHEIAAKRLDSMTELKVEVAGLVKTVELKEKENAIIILTGERDKEIHRVQLIAFEAKVDRDKMLLTKKVQSLIKQNNEFLQDIHQKE